jgi:hypothetical protein
MLYNAIALLFAAKGHNNYIAFHFFTIIEFLLLIRVFIFFQTSDLMKRLLSGVAVLYCALWILSKFRIENFQELDFFSVSISQLILAFTAVYTLFQQAYKPKGKLHNTSQFWVSLAVLYYAGCNTSLYSMTMEISHNIWAIQNIVVSIYYLILTWSLWIEGREK